MRPKHNTFDHSQFIKQAIGPERHRRGEVFQLRESFLDYPLPNQLTKDDLHLLRLTARALAFDQDPNVRWQAINALRFYGTKLDRRIAIDNLSHKDYMVRACAVELLSETARPGDEVYADIMCDDEHPVTRSFAYDALAYIFNEKAVPLLLYHLEEDEEIECKLTIWKQLEEFKVPGNWRSLIEEQFESGENARIKSMARTALEWLETPTTS